MQPPATEDSNFKNIKTMIHEYLTYLQQNRHYSENTVKAYQQDLHHFISWAKPHGLRWSTLTKQDIDAYVASQYKQTAPSTINRRITALRTMLRWAMINGKVANNPARFVQAVKTTTSLPTVADKDALNRYMATEATTDKTVIVQALLAVLMDTGIRLQEAIDIRIEDINNQEKSIRIHGKGKKERIVYYTDRLIKYCYKVGNRRLGYLLPINDQMTLRYMMYDELRPYTRTHPHAIRHLWATEAISKGANIKAVAALMGHESVKTTERYTHITNEWLKSQYNVITKAL